MRIFALNSSPDDGATLQFRYNGGATRPHRDSWKNFLKKFNREFYNAHFDQYQGVKFSENILAAPAIQALAEKSKGLGYFAQTVAKDSAAAIKDVVETLYSQVDTRDAKGKARPDNGVDLLEIIAWNDKNPDKELLSVSAGERKFAELSNGNEVTEESLTAGITKKIVDFYKGADERLPSVLLIKLQKEFALSSDLFSDKDRREGITAKGLARKVIAQYDQEIEEWNGDSYVRKFGDGVVDFTEAKDLISLWETPTQ